MKIDDILLLRTIILFTPFIIVSAYFYLNVRDQFFLKPRTHIQLNLIMIYLCISFVQTVYWHLSLREYSFLGFFIKNASGNTSTILVLLGTLTAVLGWLFTNRGQALTAIRSHSIQTLMASRLSEAYTQQVEIATEFYCIKKKEKGQSYCLTYEEYNALEQKQRNAINYLLNYFEFISVGIRFGDLDEKLMKNSLRTIIKNNYEFFEDVIKQKQQNSPSLYEHLTSLKKRWNI